MMWFVCPRIAPYMRMSVRIYRRDIGRQLGRSSEIILSLISQHWRFHIFWRKIF